ncbi:heavy metal-associated isoprenylated plant protein 47 isoform X2 [Amborella trichopoda]|uniref:heavy metal-associated isoprenylated plant protein 47 isoform X2 n=1 Tax=Amborella trichopoda TaxID=13333 RepID=UPI0005D41C51|nr:heavy metal-associated isoprenylated plant protein 47 isoform X2 [Amborella trichopoda]|eukprot:XP_011628238.1 heavy metal-associated isoprenylated plant protein 47 isoform X2 [Amborella trichopoda]
MKREVVIEVTVNCEKCRIQAFKDVSKARGVETIKIDGAKKDQLTVIGEEIDSVCLAASLRKKFCCVNIVKVTTGNEKKEEKKKEEKKEEKWQPPLPPCYYIERCPYQCYVEPIEPGCNIL